jgi:hypothetical protein
VAVDRGQVDGVRGVAEVGLAVSRCNDGSFPVAAGGRFRGPTDCLITVCGDHEWRVFERLPRERQCTHSIR